MRGLSVAVEEKGATIKHNYCVHVFTPLVVVAGILALAPYFTVGFFPDQAAKTVRGWPVWARIACPVVLGLPYLLVACDHGVPDRRWLLLYAGLPVAMAALLSLPAHFRSLRKGGWLELALLLFIGLAVDLRWFERAWPAHLAVFSKVLLLDAGIYGFLLVRNLEGVGFDLRLRGRDAAIGLREFLFYLPLALLLGLALRFLHLHSFDWDRGRVAGRFVGAWIYTFFLIAVPEELFFRGWMQNLLERHMGRGRALALTAVLFGLSHFNKRTEFFNWRYVLMASLAGLFYGRAWRHDRRVGASAVTHASVDSVWSIWLR